MRRTPSRLRDRETAARYAIPVQPSVIRPPTVHLDVAALNARRRQLLDRARANDCFKMLSERYRTRLATAVAAGDRDVVGQFDSIEHELARLSEWQRCERLRHMALTASSVGIRVTIPRSFDLAAEMSLRLSYTSLVRAADDLAFNLRMAGIA